MSTENKNNPFAFPQNEFCDNLHSDFKGMTLRDYFANAAMQGHLATDYGILHNSDNHNDNMLCARFYEFADAMLKQREL